VHTSHASCVCVCEGQRQSSARVHPRAWQQGTSPLTHRHADREQTGARVCVCLWCVCFTRHGRLTSCLYFVLRLDISLCMDHRITNYMNNLAVLHTIHAHMRRITHTVSPPRVKSRHCSKTHSEFTYTARPQPVHDSFAQMIPEILPRRPMWTKFD